jgi:hypothetical protein
MSPHSQPHPQLAQTESSPGQSPTLPSATGLDELDPIIAASFDERTFFSDLDGLCPDAVSRLAGIAWDLDPSQPVGGLEEATNRLFNWSEPGIAAEAATATRKQTDSFDIPTVEEYEPTAEHHDANTAPEAVVHLAETFLVAYVLAELTQLGD